MVVPALHVHVSGSGGTSMCSWARQQPSENGHAGGAWACFMPCKGNLKFRSELLGTKKTHQHCAQAYSSCAELQRFMAVHHYGVIGMYETFLPEMGRSPQAPVCRTGATNQTHSPCCICNAPSLSDRPYTCGTDGGKTSLLQVLPGQASPFDARFPLSQLQRGSTFCPNIRYTFIMQHPIDRIAQMLTSKCTRCRNATLVAECASRVLDDVYAADLVLDTADGKYMMGTAAVNDYNVRMLLGPRTFFARLSALDKTHLGLAEDMLRSYAVVAPLSHFGSIGPILQAQLNWTHLATPKRNSHKKSDAYHAVYARVHSRLTARNQLDLKLYETVNAIYRERTTRR